MTIEVNDKQARLIAEALEEYSRILCGQFDLTFIKSLETALYRNAKLDGEFWSRRNIIDIYLKKIKQLVFTELRDSESYGIGHFDEADLGYEMYKQILYTFESREQKKKGKDYKSNVHSTTPLKLTKEPVIKITDD